MRRSRSGGGDRLQLLEAITRLSLELGEPHREEELAHLFVQTLRDLMPTHYVCVRLLDPHTLELSSLFAEGPLRRDAREAPVVLRPEEIRRLGLTASPRGPIAARRTYRPIFEGGVAGLVFPLALGGKLYGVLNVEATVRRRPEGAFLAPVATTLSVALRNARLLTETEFLRDYLAKLLDHANALILVCDRERRITVFNRALERLTGYARDEVIGKTVGRWLPESDGGLRRALAAALRGQDVAGFEAKLPRRRGGTRRAVFNTAAVTTSDGQIEGIIAIGQDTSGVEELERQVIQAEKLATLGQLAAGVAHELGNPLTAILAHAGTLAKKAERAGQAGDLHKLGRILEAGERMQKLTRELTQYARPDADENQEIDVNGVVDQSLAFCEHLLGDAVSVQREYAPSLPPASGVRSQIQQVFVNLITNARHAIEKRGSIRLRTRLGEPGHLAIDVDDDGRGIEERDLARVFEPFFTTRVAGTGLGLSIVKSIVEAHGGTVRVASRRGRGTTFTVTLPTAKGAR